MPLLVADITMNDEASAELKRTWRELARAYFMKHYPCISLEGGENNETPEWAALGQYQKMQPPKHKEGQLPT